MKGRVCSFFADAARDNLGYNETELRQVAANDEHIGGGSLAKYGFICSGYNNNLLYKKYCDNGCHYGSDLASYCLIEPGE